ncbi:MAG: outer membrane beta-barrel domain-containing protein, partial [Nitrospinota bacterium]
MKTLCAFCISILMICCGVKNSYCEEIEDKDHVYAIQDRIYDRYHELGLNFGYIPDDSFHNAFPVGINYIYHFNEHLAWEVVRAQWVMNQEKDLKEDLETRFGVRPTEFDKLKYLIHTNFIIKPSYGKDAVWNRGIVNHESYLFLGIGIAEYETQFSNGNSSTQSVPSISLGVGRKYFLNKHLSINLEIRDLINLKKEKTENNIYFGIGIGYRFNLSPRKTKTDSNIEDL